MSKHMHLAVCTATVLAAGVLLSAPAVMAEGKRNQPVGFSGRGRLKDSQYGVQLAQKLGRQALIGTAASTVFGQMVESGMGESNDSELIDALRALSGKR